MDEERPELLKISPDLPEFRKQRLREKNKVIESKIEEWDKRKHMLDQMNDWQKAVFKIKEQKRKEQEQKEREIKEKERKEKEERQKKLEKIPNYRKKVFLDKEEERERKIKEQEMEERQRCELEKKLDASMEPWQREWQQIMIMKKSSIMNSELNPSQSDLGAQNVDGI